MKKVSNLFFDGTLRSIEFLCNLFMILLPLALVAYTLLSWLKSGQLHWLAVKDVLEWKKFSVPAKLPTMWEGVNILYKKSLTSPLALVSFFIGLGWLFVGSVVAAIAPKH